MLFDFEKIKVNTDNADNNKTNKIDRIIATLLFTKKFFIFITIMLDAI